MLWLYEEPYGHPYKWTYEKTGIVYQAVLAYLDHHRIRSAITFEQTRLVRDYIRYYVNAPAFNQIDPKHITELREQAEQAESPDEIEQVYQRCLQLGLEPL